MGLRYRYLTLFSNIIILITALLLTNTSVAEPVVADSGEAKIMQQSLGRDFGILVGDQISHHYLIDVPANFSLSPASLPAKGDINYWLKIVSVSYKEISTNNNRKSYQLDMVFQTFYAPLDVRILSTPTVLISFYNGDNEIKLNVPAWPFSMSPLKESSAAGGQSRTFMKPDIPALAIDTYTLKLKVYVLIAAVLIMSILWLILTGRLLSSVRSPFQQAARDIKSLRRKHDVTQVETAIHLVHQAFNSQANYAVFSHQIDQFITTYPEFSSNKQKIESFYELSINVLYADSQVTLEQFEVLLDLCRTMARSERLALKK